VGAVALARLAVEGEEFTELTGEPTHACLAQLGNAVEGTYGRFGGLAQDVVLHPFEERADRADETVQTVGAGVPLAVLRDTIQPFPTFSEIYVDALDALNAAVREPVGAGSP
jgi:hypothetical protein